MFFTYGQDQQMLQIKGNITDLDPQDKLSLKFDGNTAIDLDLENQSFQANFVLPATGSWVFLYINGPRGLRYTSYYLGNEKVEINASGLNLSRDNRAIGSKMDSIRYIHYQTQKLMEIQGDSLLNQFKQLSKSDINIDSLQASFESKLQVMEASFEFGFLKQYINTPYAIQALSYAVANGLSKDDSKELLSLIEPRYENQLPVKFIQDYVNYPFLKKGDLYYDFVGLNKDDMPVYFRDQFDQRYVLLRICNAYCSFCIAENDDIQTLSDTLKDDLNVVSLSYGDKQEFQELLKITDPKAQVLYFPKGIVDPVFAKYALQITPTYFLFSNKGELLLTKQGSGEGLKEFIEQDIKDNRN
ncbi:TlpA family protein disulfide reductase [Myroides sp. LJL119]